MVERWQLCTTAEAGSEVTTATAATATTDTTAPAITTTVLRVPAGFPAGTGQRPSTAVVIGVVVLVTFTTVMVMLGALFGHETPKPSSRRRLVHIGHRR